jgi:hypothetical protein
MRASQFARDDLRDGAEGRDPVRRHYLPPLSRAAFEVEAAEAGPIAVRCVQTAEREFPAGAVGASCGAGLAAHRAAEAARKVVGRG